MQKGFFLFIFWQRGGGGICFKAIIMYCWTRLHGNQVVRLPIKHPAGKQQMNSQTGEERDSSGLFIAQPWIVGGPIPPWCMAPVSTPGGGSLCKKVAAGPCHGNLRSERVTTSAHLQLLLLWKKPLLFFLLPFCPRLRNVAGRAQRWAVASLCGSDFWAEEVGILKKCPKGS